MGPGRINQMRLINLQGRIGRTSNRDDLGWDRFGRDEFGRRWAELRLFPRACQLFRELAEMRLCKKRLGEGVGRCSDRGDRA